MKNFLKFCHEESVRGHVDADIRLLNILLRLRATSVRFTAVIGSAVLVCLGNNWSGKPAKITPSAVFTRWDQYFLSDLKTLNSDPGLSLKNISALTLYLSSIKTSATRLLLSTFESCFKKSPHTFFCCRSFAARAPLAFLSSFQCCYSFWTELYLYNCIFWMVGITLVTKKNGWTIYFDDAIPKVHFIKLLSCSLFNSWFSLRNEGSEALEDEKSDKSLSGSKLPFGHYTLESLVKEWMGC